MHALAQLVHHQHSGSFDCKEVLWRCLTVDMLVRREWWEESGVGNTGEEYGVGNMGALTVVVV